MRFGKKVICLVKDPNGFGAALFDALRPVPPSRRELSSFEIPSLAEKYGIAGNETATPVEIAQFFATDGSVEISILLLSNLQPPAAACVANELLLLLSSESTSYPQLLIFPYHVSTEGLITSTPDGRKGGIFGIGLGSSSDAARAILDAVPNPPSTLRFHNEILNCMMHLVQIYKMSGILLAGIGSQNRHAADQALDILQQLGSLLADHFGLTFSTEMTSLTCEEMQTAALQEPWRALYG